MGTGGRQRGRRDNGLVAAEYAVAGDVDPRIGEHLLDVLAAGGIAAYLQPAADLHPVTRTTTVPPRPTDRLYVDREHLDTARDHLRQLTAPAQPEDAEHVDRAPVDPVPIDRADTDGDRGDGKRGDRTHGDPDLDAAFARIVAGLEAELDPGAWPKAADDEERPTRAAARPARDEEPSLLDALDTFGADLPDEEGSYTPPPPPPIPRPSRAAVLSVIAIVAGFLLFVRPDIAPVSADLGRLVGLAVCAGGVIGLIWRLRPGDEDDEDWDPDDGARV